MATKKGSNQPAANHFDHPAAGRSERVNRYAAVRWKPGATTEQKDELLRKAGVELATHGNEVKRPLTNVNQTDGLSWVQAGSEKGLSSEAWKALEASEWVAWVAPAFRGGQEKAAIFTVNPTRFYVWQAALDSSGGLAALKSPVAMDSQRPSRLPGYVAVVVEDASVAGGRSSIDVAREVTAALTAGGTSPERHLVRYETIPFLSPEAHATSLAPCVPPASEFTPSDPMFAQQWGLQRTNVPRAWQMVRGSDAITVAVIDTGVQLNHPDLNLHPQSWNASTDTPDGSPTGNHGTACAGIIGARLDNSQGVSGAAGGVRIMAIATATWADVDIAEALYFAADNGARIVSMSFGVYPSWMMWDFALIQDALQHAYDKGLVLIAASGNENGAQARFPGSDARTLCVGGSNRSDERKRVGDSSSENWWGASYGPDVDVVAPCLEMPTTDRLGALGYSPGDYYDHFNGTSSATPLVAGIAGLILSLRPTLTNVEVRHLIESTCDKIAPHLYTYTNVGSKPSGTWHEEVGYGRVNAERALLAACAIEGGKGPCVGCGGDCLQPTPEICRSPAPVPWLPHDRCMTFYEVRTFDPGELQDRRIQIRITYEHRLCLVGRQQGPLLYTTTLLPGEEVRLFEFDRFRRVRSETERVSVHTSFRQTLSALSQSRRSTSVSAYLETLTDVRTHSDVSVSAGGGLAGFLGAPEVSGKTSTDQRTTIASGASVRIASDQFSQLARTASQSIEAERSLVVSTFEDSEHQNTTARKLKNDNRCYAVTYFVRRVNEVYELSSRIVSVEWRLGDQPWRDISDLEGTPDGIRKLFDKLRQQIPRVGDVVRDARHVTIPTDGTLYETELAHCSSCEPQREAEENARLERLRLANRRRCLELELLALEVERRRSLVGSADATLLELPPWPLVGPASAPALPDANSGEDASDDDG